MSHIRNVGLQRISYSNKPGACQSQKRGSKSFTISLKDGPRFGVQKTGPVWGSVFYVDIARFSFSNMEPKKGVHFSTSKLGFLFCCFSVVAIAILRLRGWLIFIRISNSGRPTVLIVGSWFVVWLLNNRPALHTVGRRFTYQALRVVLEPISRNRRQHCLKILWPFNLCPSGVAIAGQWLLPWASALWARQS